MILHDSFHISTFEDKVILEEECNVRPSIVFQYSKRKKKENACVIEDEGILSVIEGEVTVG